MYSIIEYNKKRLNDRDKIIIFSVAANPTLFISRLLHYALTRFLHFSEKTYGSTFEKWTFSECPISDNTKTNLLFVIYILCGILIIVGHLYLTI